MKTYNIILAGVGGQGLVLTTKIISEAGMMAGYDVKSNDVIGLSQRGGKVWGSIRMGDRIHSPNIPPKTGDILLAFEPLEGLRWSGALKDGGLIVLNEAIVHPVPVIAEKAVYTEDIKGVLAQRYQVITLNANEEGRKLGSIKVANIFLVGIMARRMDIPVAIWHEVLKKNVPEKFTEMNVEAFDKGYDFKV